MSRYPGWEALIKTVEKDIDHKSDLLVVIVHYFLVNVNNFSCLGLGDHSIIDKDDISSELLPDGWNINIIYNLRYVLRDHLFVLVAVRTDQMLLVNMIDSKTLDSTVISIDIEAYVRQKTGKLHQVVPNIHILLARLDDELISGLNMTKVKDKSIQVHMPRDVIHGIQRRNFFAASPIGPFHNDRNPRDFFYQLWDT